jgi:hypothetical protein
MKSIKADYKRLQRKAPLAGAYLSLSQAVLSKNYCRKSVVKAFHDLMPIEEYSLEEGKALIDYLEFLTKMPEEGEFSTKFTLWSGFFS